MWLSQGATQTQWATLRGFLASTSFASDHTQSELLSPRSVMPSACLTLGLCPQGLVLWISSSILPSLALNPGFLPSQVRLPRPVQERYCFRRARPPTWPKAIFNSHVSPLYACSLGHGCCACCCRGSVPRAYSTVPSPLRVLKTIGLLSLDFYCDGLDRHWGNPGWIGPRLYEIRSYTTSGGLHFLSKPQGSPLGLSLAGLETSVILTSRIRPPRPRNDQECCAGTWHPRGSATSGDTPTPLPNLNFNLSGVDTKHFPKHTSFLGCGHLRLMFQGLCPQGFLSCV
jgi:hypothetical protein